MQSLIEKLMPYVEDLACKTDPAHDVLHAKRVLNNVLKIHKKEGGSLKILIPAALFHDIIIYPKDDIKSPYAQEESAEKAVEILKLIDVHYSQSELDHVYKIIDECSFSKNIDKTCLEGKILQDADGLEGVGAFAIMRAFASTGQMQRPFYNEEDTFCEWRDPKPKEYALDLFSARLFKIKERMCTKEALLLLKDREEFLRDFIKQTKVELINPSFFEF